MNERYLDRLLKFASRHLTREQMMLLSAADVPLTGPNGLRRWICERDIEAFTQLYFPDEFLLDAPPIHQRFCKEIEEVRRRSIGQERGLKVARAIPRGHAKSTFWSRICPMHALLYGWSHLTVLLGNTQSAAERLLANIRTSLEQSEEIKEDFGQVRGKTWTDQKVTSADGNTIYAFGVGNGAIRGVSNPRRPRLVIGDDLDDDQLVRSAVELEAAKTWFDKAVLPLGDNVSFTTSFVVLGTVIKKTSLLCHILGKPDFDTLVDRGVQRFADNQELWELWRLQFLDLARQGKTPKEPESDAFYQANKTELLKGTQVLWDRKDGYYGMMVYKTANGDAAFNSEIQNSPSESGGRLGIAPRGTLPTGRPLTRLGYLDWTIKGAKANDMAAFVECLLDRKEKRLYVVRCDAATRAYNDTIDVVMKRLKAESFQGVWIEGNSAGSIIADLLDEKIGAAGLPYTAQRVNHSSNKVERISALAEWASRGQLVFVEGEGIDELLSEWADFPDVQHDDRLDALVSLVECAEEAGMLELDIPTVEADYAQVYQWAA